MCTIHFRVLLFISLFNHLQHFIHSNRISSKSLPVGNDLQNVSILTTSHKNSLDKSNISNYLWYLFQNRNTDSRRLQKPILYYTPTPNSNNEIDNVTSIRFNRSDMFSGQKPLHRYNNNNNHLQTSGNVNIFRRLKDDQLPVKAEINSNFRTLNQLLQTSQLSIVPSKIPSIPNERPFHHDQVLLSYNEMIRLLGVQNFNSDFMSFNKPWEAVIFPTGRLIYSALMKPDKNSFDEPMTSLHRNRRSRKLKPNNQEEFINIYGQYKRSRRRPNHVGSTQSNKLFRNIMHRLKLIQNLKNDDQSLLHEKLLHFRSNQRRFKKNRQLKRILREFVNDYNSCPLYYVWYDLGSKFWPRWIKTSQCVNLGNISCSLPPGMFCHEKRIETIAILRYICPEKWPLSKCNWYRIRLPIVTECSCQCTNHIIDR
ncbi:unnamed protein product, partial [Schistosoma turkestanicum]